MNDLKFKNIMELYQRLNPALESKVKEFNLCGIKYIKDIDIFEYLSRSKWENYPNLTLYDMVSDIFNLSVDDISKYMAERNKE